MRWWPLSRPVLLLLHVLTFPYLFSLFLCWSFFESHDTPTSLSWNTRLQRIIQWMTKYNSLSDSSLVNVLFACFHPWPQKNWRTSWKTWEDKVSCEYFKERKDRVVKDSWPMTCWTERTSKEMKIFKATTRNKWHGKPGANRTSNESKMIMLLAAVLLSYCYQEIKKIQEYEADN